MAATTTNELLEDVKSRGLVPSTQNTFKDSDIINWANDELALSIVPLVLKYHQNYFLTEVEIPITTDTLVYSIPDRAIGGKMDDIKIKFDDQILFSPAMVSRHDRDYYQEDAMALRWAYTIMGNSLVFVNKPDRNASLVIQFVRRPNKLVLASQSRRVTAKTGNTIEFNAPADWINSGNPLDFVSVFNETTAVDMFPDVVDSFNKTATFTDISRVQVGDWITPAGKTAVVNLPDELVTILAERLSARIQQAIGDQAGVAMSLNRVAEMEKNLGLLMADRIAGETPRVLNRHSFMRNRGYRRNGVR